MAKISILDLKAAFETGDKPTGADFVNLIDTLEDVSSLKSGAFQNITVATTDPVGGADGDIWVKYTP